MKNIMTTILFLGSIYLGIAQENAISKYFNMYQDNTAYTKVSVTSKMFSLFTELDTEDPDEKAVVEAIGKLEGIKGLFNDTVEDGIGMYKEATGKISADSQYEELMSVEDENENIKFYVSDQNGKISELLMVRGGEHEFMVMTLYGEIDLNAISKMSKIINIKGMDKLHKLDEH